MLAQIELWTKSDQYKVGVYFLPKKVAACWMNWFCHNKNYWCMLGRSSQP
ncbi:hypothetical protein [Mycoplasma yeatsii]